MLRGDRYFFKNAARSAHSWAVRPSWVALIIRLRPSYFLVLIFALGTVCVSPPMLRIPEKLN